MDRASSETLDTLGGRHVSQPCAQRDCAVLLAAGESARSTAEHTLNANSSRSHSIFTVQVQVRHGPDRPALALSGQT